GPPDSCWELEKECPQSRETCGRAARRGLETRAEPKPVVARSPDLATGRTAGLPVPASERRPIGFAGDLRGPHVAMRRSTHPTGATGAARTPSWPAGIKGIRPSGSRGRLLGDRPPGLRPPKIVAPAGGAGLLEQLADLGLVGRRRGLFAVPQHLDLV